MKGYIDPSTKQLIDKRRKLLDQLEVLNHQIQEFNKKITLGLFNSLAGTQLRFHRDNSVSCKTKDKRSFTRMPVDEDFVVIEAALANTMDDIIYVLKGTVSKTEYIIMQPEFKDFDFIN